MLRACPLLNRFAALTLVLLALSWLGALPAGARSPVASAASRAPAVTGGPTGQGLATQAAATRQRLLAGTRRLESTKAQLASALRQVQQSRASQAEARQELARAAAGLNDFVAAAYRESSSATLSLLLQEGNPQDVLTAAGYLDQAGSYQSEMLADWRAAEVRAGVAGRQADQAARRASAVQQQVFTQVAQLQSAAAGAAGSLSRPGQASRGPLRQPLPATDLASLAAAGYPNGLIPTSALCGIGIKIGSGAAVLRCDAAAAFRKLAPAYAQAFGHPICLTDAYRSYAQQVAVYRERPSLAAVPGTSNHGWGLAVDLCGGLQTAGSPQDRWMHANAGRFGWAHPKWAEPGGSRPEPWHWEFVGGVPAG